MSSDGDTVDWQPPPGAVEEVEPFECNRIDWQLQHADREAEFDKLLFEVRTVVAAKRFLRGVEETDDEE